MKPFFLAIRPKTLIASISPVCIGTAFALSEGKFHFWVFLVTLFTGLGIQITTNVANDLFDFLKGADTHQRKGPIRVTQSGLMSVSQVKILSFSMVAASAFFGSILLFRGGFWIAPLVALALCLAFGYTAGPFPLAYLGIAEFFIFIFFGPIASGFSYYLQTLHFGGASFLAGLCPGMLSCSLLIINNLRDIAEDRQAKKKTLVARFGQVFGKWEFTLFLLLGCTIPLLFSFRHPLLLLAALTYIPAYFLIQSVVQNQEPIRYGPLLGQVGKLLTVQTVIFSLGLIL